jgi:hypothetical protein
VLFDLLCFYILEMEVDWNRRMRKHFSDDAIDIDFPILIVEQKMSD